MKFIEYFIGSTLALLPLPFALLILVGIIIWVSCELSEISAEPNYFAKLLCLGRAVLIALAGSYLGGLYIDGTGTFPSGISSKILFFSIMATSLVLGIFFSRPKPGPKL